ncbi:MAG: histone acetyltransferase [Herbinix sp.]|jgi:radical SAM superfamily enzyme|nr:histone acetyltransferase [Herbinix sp.]
MNIIFLSELASNAFIDYMKTRGTVILIPKDDRFDSRIASHPDLVISILDDTLIIDENAHRNIFQQLNALSIPYVSANSKLAAAYPQDIAYNAVITKNNLLHHLDHTNSLLLLHSESTNKKLISVKQGYTKCSTVVVSDHALITSDQGIYHAAKDYMKLLLIQPGHVLLEGYDFGFLGGTSGVLEDTVIFHGDLSKHPDFLQIKAFLEKMQKKLLYFEEFPLTDIGSMLIFKYDKRNAETNTSFQKHVNIPIFISHEGCPNDCVFCNQRKITAKPEPMTLDEVREQIELYSSTLNDQTYIELAFFGGSFTGIDARLQESYLNLAYEYKKAGKLQAIRLSTRPDYISREILDRLKLYQVDTIELGVQSLNEEVLKASNRGHMVSDVYRAVDLIKSYGFQLGIQLMVGLPEDTKERTVLSSKLTALLRPDFIRIYPTLVIKETELLQLCRQGKYHALTMEEAVDWTKEMYKVFLQDQISVIRMGLQPTELIAEGKEVLYGPFHPAFRQLVESAYFLELLHDKLIVQSSSLDKITAIKILCNPRDLSQVIGHKRRNMITLQKEFPQLQVVPDESIHPMSVKLQIS